MGCFPVRGLFPMGFKPSASQEFGTVVDVEMTASTGKYIKFLVDMVSGTNVSVDWGDGTTSTKQYTSTSNVAIDHTYQSYGKFKIRFQGAKSVCFRYLDGGSATAWDGAILSFVDYSGDISDLKSGAFKACGNLTKYIAPKLMVCGQASLGNCRNLKTVSIGPIGMYYDRTFSNCSELTSFTADYGAYGTRAANIAASVWSGCSLLTELHLGNVNGFYYANAFSNCPKLDDIYIDNHTVEEIKQVASSNIVKKLYSGGTFPWGARSSCRFHGTNGIVYGDGTIVHS